MTRSFTTSRLTLTLTHTDTSHPPPPHARRAKNSRTTSKVRVPLGPRCCSISSSFLRHFHQRCESIQAGETRRRRRLAGATPAAALPAVVPLRTTMQYLSVYKRGAAAAAAPVVGRAPRMRAQDTPRGRRRKIRRG